MKPYTESPVRERTLKFAWLNPLTQHILLPQSSRYLLIPKKKRKKIKFLKTFLLSQFLNSKIKNSDWFGFE
jgi:hypothetical protein